MENGQARPGSGGTTEKKISGEVVNEELIMSVPKPYNRIKFPELKIPQKSHFERKFRRYSRKPCFMDGKNLRNWETILFLSRVIQSYFAAVHVLNGCLSLNILLILATQKLIPLQRKLEGNNIQTWTSVVIKKSVGLHGCVSASTYCNLV